MEPIKEEKRARPLRICSDGETPSTWSELWVVPSLRWHDSMNLTICPILLHIGQDHLEYPELLRLSWSVHTQLGAEFQDRPFSRLSSAVRVRSTFPPDLS